MKVEFQCITEHGKTWKDANIEKIKEGMACPQCGHSYDDPKPYPFTNDELIKHCQPGHFYLVKIYSPIEFSKETETEVGFGCYSCDAEWLVKVTEKNMIFTKGRK